MARIKGFRCDGPKCNQVTEHEELPAGWITALVRQSPVTNGRAAEASDFQFCSNVCAMRLFRARWRELDKGTVEADLDA